jgi:hypothetical protein
MDITMDNLCATHPGIASTGRCDNCQKAYCDQCRVEDIADDRNYCSATCLNASRTTLDGANLSDDDALYAGYAAPYKTGFRLWARSFKSLTVSLLPLSLIVALGFVAFQMSADGLINVTGVHLGMIVVAALLFGVAVCGVVLSRVHTGQVVEGIYLTTIRRFIPWLVSWVLVMSLTLLGYVAFFVPGIYLNMRLIWADEFALVHGANPFKALDHSWQISTDHVSQIFGFEFVVGFFATIFLIPGIAFLVAAMSIDADTPLYMAGVTGVSVYLLLIGYGAMHACQVAYLYGLRSNHARVSVDKPTKPLPVLLKWTGAIVAVGLVWLIALAFMQSSGTLPSDRVLVADAISQEQLDVLRAEHIISEDEAVEFFFSEGLLDIEEGGSVLTNARVIVYYTTEDDELEVFSIANVNIYGVEQTQEGDAANYSIYRVHGRSDEEYVDLWLPHENGDDQMFVSAVESKIVPEEDAEAQPATTEDQF